MCKTRFTQPQLYKAIAKHQNPRDIYAAQLIAQNIITQADIKQLEIDYKNSLEVDLEDSRKVEKTIITPFMADEWEGLSLAKESKMMDLVDTKVSERDLTEIATTITTLPSNKKFLRKIEKLIGDRKRMYFESDAMDWAMGELLAYGTLLKEGFAKLIRPIFGKTDPSARVNCT